VQTVAVVLAVVAALIHVYIFVLESLRWTAPSTRATFGTTAQQAEATRQLAFNQGFYNLFLAIVTAIGVTLLLTGQPSAGRALLLAGTGSMVAAALVLIVSDRSKARAAAVQGVAPLLAVVFLLFSVA
jgi:putative membrane protein